MIEIPAPCPPEIERAIGYEGNARYCAFYWISGADEIVYDDGFCSGTGNWQVYLAWAHHRTVQPYLMGALCPSCNGQSCPSCHHKGFTIFNFGDSDREAEHWLLLDCQQRQWSAGRVKEVQRFLIEQHPPKPPLSPITAEHWNEVQEAIATRIRGELAQILTADVWTLLERDRHQVSAIGRWLDTCGGEHE